MQLDTSFLQDLIGSITERGRDLVGLTWGQEGRGEEQKARPDLVALSEALLTRRGEASGVALAAAVVGGYFDASEDDRVAWLETLAERFGPDGQRLAAAARAYLATGTAEAAAELSEASEPRRQELIRRLNLAPGGTAALVGMRAGLIRHLKSHPRLAPLDVDFRHLFSSWFNRGFLVLRRIDWTTPANILAKIIQYEAVHTIQSWDDLRARLEPPDRRCYAFFHPQLVDDPLIFVEVALTRDIPASIAPLLRIEREVTRPADATTAVFYSISNCQAGLRGVSFGNFLIKQVVEELKRDLPGLKTFVTLSPVPGLTRWLSAELKAEASGAHSPEQLAVAAPLVAGQWQGVGADATKAAVLRTLAARYLMMARTAGGRPVDEVARFHLGNGARLERINVDGDLSAKGLAQAGGVMVNYLYDLATIEANHEAHVDRGEVAASPEVRALLAPPATTTRTRLALPAAARKPR